MLEFRLRFHWSLFLNVVKTLSLRHYCVMCPLGKGPINNSPTLIQIMAWRRSGDKPLSEPMMVCLLTHICVTRPQWVNTLAWAKWPEFCWRCFQFIFLIIKFDQCEMFTIQNSSIVFHRRNLLIFNEKRFRCAPEDFVNEQKCTQETKKKHQA